MRIGEQGRTKLLYIMDPVGTAIMVKVELTGMIHEMPHGLVLMRPSWKPDKFRKR